MSRWISIITGIVLALAVIAALAFTHGTHPQTQCSSFSVSIDYGTQSGDYMLTAGEIQYQLFAACDTPLGKPIADIDIETYENTIKTLPYVADAQVYMSIDGKLKADVRQRVPLIRVIEENNNSYYLDEEGLKLPIPQEHSAHVLLAGGYITDSLGIDNGLPLINADVLLKNSRIYKVFILARYISKDEFLKALISQIYVEESGELQLIPRVGKQIIIVSDASGLEEQFTKLKHFYRDGIARVGWDRYSFINLKYKDQVICTLK